MSGRSASVRAGLSHPVIDADGHQIEFEPLLLEYLREVGGNDYVTQAQDRLARGFGWYWLTPEERRRRHAPRPPWGLQTRRPRDIAACMVPALFRESMDEIGIDFALIYPTLMPTYLRQAPSELRSAACRAMNRYSADAYADYGDRLVPAALVPMTSPAEAIAELEYAVEELGHRVIVIDCAVRRPVEALAEIRTQVSPGLARLMTWLDSFGVDSEEDYDPFWARCIELGIAPTAHMPGLWGTRTSISSYTHNHLGMFGAAGEALCKSLFLAGVTFRFPRLRLALLEGGASWACSLYADLFEHWEKRNLEAIDEYDPKHLDRDRLVSVLREHGGERYARLLERPLEEACRSLFLLSGWLPEAGWEPRNPALLDDFGRCRIRGPEDIRDHFVPNFFFGCEAEDPSVSWALDGHSLPLGARLHVMFGSDIGHWDVTDMRAVLAEAHELVERGLLDDAGFRTFAFESAVRLHGGANPDFFRGTVVEEAAAEVLRAPSGETAS